MQPSQSDLISGSIETVWRIDEDGDLRAYPSNDLDTPAIWAPQPGSQEAFLSCPVFEVLYSGTRGPGKTDALLMDFCQHVGQGFGSDWRGILFRRTFPELKDVVDKSEKWFPQIFPQATYNKSDHMWTFPDGEKLIFGFLEREADYWKYHGHQYPWLAFEELTNWPDDKLFRKMFSTCRSTNKKLPRKVRATCNPHGVGHNWVKRRYGLPVPNGQCFTELVIEEDEKGNTQPPRIAIHGTVHENKILLNADPDYISRIRASCSSPSEEAAWIDGSWDITSGGMFDDIWHKKWHTITGLVPSMIPLGWRIDRSYDHGQSKPFSVGWWAQSNGERIQLPSGQIIGTVRGDLFRIAEWYGCTNKPNTGLRLTAEEIAIGIREKQFEMGIAGRVRPGVADSSIFDEWEEGKSVAGDMRKKRVKWLPADKGKGSRIQGWQQMRKLLKNAIPIIHEDGNQTRESPGLFVSSTCKDFLRTVPSISRDKLNLDDVDTDAEDHIADEVRYRCRAKRARRVRVQNG